MRYNEVMHELGVWDEGLIQKEFQPAPELTQFVKSHQLLTGQNHVKRHRSWYLLPDNSAHLIFFLYQSRNELRPSLRIVGPRSVHKFINRARRRLTLITSFRPGGLWSFCQCPVSELTDKAFDADTFLPKINDALLDQMKQAAMHMQVDELIALMEGLLISHLSPADSATPFLNSFRELHDKPLLKVSDLASHLGLSERHLRSLTYKYIGHSPKEVLQISRFTRSLLLSNEHREWPAIAIDAGYYDQSHMISAYQRMCGSSPEKLFG